MKDKYRLTDKFIAVTAVLFPNIEDAEAEKNYKDFFKLKKLRDSIYHGEPLSEKDLPVQKMAELLRKYVVARLDTPNQALERDRAYSILVEIYSSRKVLEQLAKLAVFAEGWKEMGEMLK